MPAYASLPISGLVGAFRPMGETWSPTVRWGICSAVAGANAFLGLWLISAVGWWLGLPVLLACIFFSRWLHRRLGIGRLAERAKD